MHDRPLFIACPQEALAPPGNLPPHDTDPWRDEEFASGSYAEEEDEGAPFTPTGND